jgi:hypothetical protein
MPSVIHSNIELSRVSKQIIKIKSRELFPESKSVIVYQMLLSLYRTDPLK